MKTGQQKRVRKAIKAADKETTEERLTRTEELLIECNKRFCAEQATNERLRNRITHLEIAIGRNSRHSQH